MLAATPTTLPDGTTPLTAEQTAAMRAQYMADVAARGGSLPWYAPSRIFANKPAWLMIAGTSLFVFKRRTLGASMVGIGVAWLAYQRGKVAAYFPKGS